MTSTERCNRCGVEIQQITAQRNGGSCIPCRRNSPWRHFIRRWVQTIGAVVLFPLIALIICGLGVVFVVCDLGPKAKRMPCSKLAKQVAEVPTSDAKS